MAHYTCGIRMFDDLIKSGLSYERLHTLLKLSDAGSLIEAANNDPGKQSRLSHHLRELSAYFGVELTERTGKTTRLTREGRALEEIVRAHFSAIQAFRNRTTGTRHVFNIAAEENILQSFLIPAIGLIKRTSNKYHFQLNGRDAADIALQLKGGKLDFGILSEDETDSFLETAPIGNQRYAVFVPRRLVLSRGLLTLRDALMSCPHALATEEKQLARRLQDIAKELGGNFQPELHCGSVSQCVAAVATESYAAVLPINAATMLADKDCIVVEDDQLDSVTQKIVLAWHPRTIDIIGSTAEHVKRDLLDALKQKDISSEDDS